MISVVSRVANCIPRYIRTYLHFSIQQWGNEGGSVIARFQDFPPGYFFRTFFYVIENTVRYLKQLKLVLLQFVGGQVKKMPGLGRQIER